MAQNSDAASATSPAEDVRDPGKIESSSPGSTIIPNFALDAADAKIATWSAAIVDAADTIERLVGAESLPVPDAVRELATSTTQKLRNFGSAAGEQQAVDLVAGLQRTAAAHPAASIGIGAAVGAALATLLVRLGTTGDHPSSSSADSIKTSGDLSGSREIQS